MYQQRYNKPLLHAQLPPTLIFQEKSLESLTPSPSLTTVRLNCMESFICHILRGSARQSQSPPQCNAKQVLAGGGNEVLDNNLPRGQDAGHLSLAVHTNLQPICPKVVFNANCENDKFQCRHFIIKHQVWVMFVYC